MLFRSDYSNIARPLLDLTKKDTPWNWNNSCQNAFNRLKNCFLTKPVLHLPDTSKPFAIATDASKYASGGVLLQADSNGEWHPCSYLSQSFRAAERNYDIYDRELLAIIRGLKVWRLLRFNLVRVEICDLRPEVVAESNEVLVHYRSRTNG